MPISAQEFEQARNEFHDALVERGRGAGPMYTGDPLYLTPWYDQYFDRQIEPAGTVNCRKALRVGATQSALDVVLKAAAGNGGPLLVPAGSTITLALMQGDSESGTFEDVGPTVCVKAPAAGMSVLPGEPACRFAIGDFQKPWLMISLEFSGAITGGKFDACLGFVPR